MNFHTVRSVCAAVILGAFCGSAVANPEAIKRAADPSQWGSPGGDLALTRHSKLADISTANVDKLQMIWSQSSGTLRGHEGQPLVITEGSKTMMYLISGWPNIVQALDLADPDNPKAIWRYVKTTDRDESAVPRACCDTVNRGLSYADGKVVFGTLDGFLIALDAKTGKEVWTVKHAFPDKGETITPVPLIAEDKVLIGFGGDEFAARGRFTAYALKDGKKVWECHATGTDKDTCITKNTNKANPHYGTTDASIKSYPGDEWQRGGGASWGFYSYDPKLKMVYHSTGNPGLWSPFYRCSLKTHEECNAGTQDNKWSMTIFAMRSGPTR
jgi:lanthanide-dependent methanol dehydrogenase